MQSSQQKQSSTRRRLSAKRTARKTVSRVSGKRFVTVRDLNGYKYTPSAEIPESTPKPWYPLVVSHTGPPDEYTIALVYGYMIDQLDKEFKTFKTYSSQDGGGEVELRFHKLEVWNLTGRAVSLSVWEPPAADYSASKSGYTFNQLGGWTDAGGNDTFPRIGYTYPSHVQNYVHRADWTSNQNPFKVCNTTAGAAADTLLIRFHISWRPPGIVNFSSTIPFSPPHQALLRGVTRIKTAVESSSSAAHKDNEDNNVKDDDRLSSVIAKLETLDTDLRGIQRAIAALPHYSEVKPPSPRLTFDECDDAPQLQHDV